MYLRIYSLKIDHHIWLQLLQIDHHEVIFPPVSLRSPHVEIIIPEDT
jgi:hypothetical protein